MAKGPIEFAGDLIGWFIRGVIVVELFILGFYSLHVFGTHFMSADPIANARAITSFWIPIMKIGVMVGLLAGIVGYFKRKSIKLERHELFGWMMYGSIAFLMFVLLIVGSLQFGVSDDVIAVEYYKWLWLFGLTHIVGMLVGVYGYKNKHAEMMTRLYGNKPAPKPVEKKDEPVEKKEEPVDNKEAVKEEPKVETPSQDAPTQ